MLKKILPLFALAFILISTPALASQNKNNTSTNSQATCDEDEEWENHGSYVSCVARLHEGGSVVSEAAKSDIGKKHHDEDEDEDDNSPSPTPITSPSPVVSPSPTVEPSAQPSVSPTPSPTPTSEPVIQENINLLQELITKLGEIIGNLQNLI